MLVSCICPTMASRREWLPKAIACFDSQTIEEKELIVVDDSPSARTLGDKRNLACARAKGEFIAHLDDDDWSAPGRLADQIALLVGTGKAVTGYHSMRFTDGSRWWKNVNTSRFAFGTSLVYRRDWWQAHPFPSLQIGEDAHFVNAAAREKQLIAVDAGDLMYATNHPGNTSRRHIGEGWIEVFRNA